MKDNPIINSLLDIDFYKLTMAQGALLNAPKMVARYQFQNRTAIPLVSKLGMGVIREEIENIFSLKMPSNIEEVLTKPITNANIFKLEFNRFLMEDFNKKKVKYELKENNGRLDFEFWGEWPKAIIYETLIMSALAERYSEYLMKDMLKSEKSRLMKTAEKKALAKVKKIKKISAIKIADFGTRRRFSREWQKRVLEIFINESPDNIVGTSNVQLAEYFGMTMIGTCAHEWTMAMAYLFELLFSQKEGIRLWYDLYKDSPWLLCALTDTYGTEAFFKDFAGEMAQKYGAIRQDSGCPYEFGTKAIRFYKNQGIDPREKTIVFSDSLNVEAIIGLYKEFSNSINVAFGWGTNLTNDIGFKPISMVIKLIKAGNVDVAKLSDDPGKYSGNISAVRKAISTFNYKEGKKVA